LLALVNPDDRQRVIAAVNDALHNRRSFSETYRVCQGDGNEIVVYAQAEVTFDAEGRGLRMLGIAQDVTVQHRAAQQLRAALEQKEMLLREVHHRVKNNLQVISSLLFLQSQKANDPALTRMLDEMEWRVKAMALIHENLYQSTDVVRVDFRRYLQMLMDGLTSAHAGRPVHVGTRLDDVSLEIQKAVPCGLIVNELVTNAFLHAFKNGAQGTIRVEFSQCNGRLELLVIDDGVGLPPEAQLNQSTSLGLRLVHNLTEQIGGKLEVHRERGTAFRLTFAL
jgi:two-component sensor histidine kinase